MLLVLKKDGLGWATQMEGVLERYGLERDWEKIKKMEARTWKTADVETTEKMNKETILQMCQGRNGEKTKTKMIIPILKSDNYQRRPFYSVINRTKPKVRILIMSMFGMRMCNKNFKCGAGEGKCRTTV